MLRKIDDYEVNHQPNVKIFVWHHNNTIERQNKRKSIMKFN
jgi:hypothetical protein